MLNKALLALLVIIWAVPASSQFVVPGKKKRPAPQEPKFLIEAVAEDREAKALHNEDVENRLADTALAVRNAFEDRDADRINGLLVSGSGRKINISLRLAQEDKGYYGSAQIRYIFKRLFGDVMTESFEVEPEGLEPLSKKDAEFNARWRYLVVETGEETTTRLSFKLVLDDDAKAWRIYSISDR